MAKKNSIFGGQTKDLTQGNIFTCLMLFALPLLMGQFFQTLYNSVDSIIIGNFESASALAAVTASGTISMIISGFFNGMSAGSSALFARLFGAKDYRKLHDAIHTAIVFGTILGFVLSGLGVIFTPQILKITDCPPEVTEQAIIYLRIYLIGVLFTSIYNLAAGVLRAVGDSKSPFIFLVISSVLNIILDVIFVALLGMGVAGVAIATIIAQGVSMVLAFRQIMQLDPEYRFRFSHIMVDWRLLGEVAALGVPAGLQTSITAISNIFVQRYINSFSAYAIAGVGSAMRVDQFAGMPCMTLGLAMTTFIGQNIGAGRNDRANRAVGISVLISIGFVVIISIPAYIFAPQLIRIFSPDAEVITYGTGMLRVIMPLYIFMGLNGLIGGVLRGYGYSFTSMICSICGMVAMRQIWLYITLHFIAHDIMFVYYGYPVGWVCSFLPQLIIYLTRIRKKYPSKAAESM